MNDIKEKWVLIEEDFKNKLILLEKNINKDPILKEVVKTVIIMIMLIENINLLNTKEEKEKYFETIKEEMEEFQTELNNMCLLHGLSY